MKAKKNEHKLDVSLAESHNHTWLPFYLGTVYFRNGLRLSPKTFNRVGYGIKRDFPFCVDPGNCDLRDCIPKKRNSDLFVF